MVSKTLDMILAGTLGTFIGSQIAAQGGQQLPVEPEQAQQLYSAAKTLAESFAYSLPIAAGIYAGFRSIDYAVRKLMGGGG